MSLLIKTSGILTTIQDLGRFGYRRFGINPGGAMDRTAVRLLNVLLSNEENSPVLEMHFPAPAIEFTANAIIALGGADLGAEIDGRNAPNWRLHQVAASKTLRFTKKISGERCYLAVRGGFAADIWLGSAGTNLRAGIGGRNGRQLSAGDVIETNAREPQGALLPTGFVAGGIIPSYSPFPRLRVIPGAEFEQLTENSLSIFLNEAFEVSRNSDRMGYRLAGTPLETQRPIEMQSAATSFGTVQLLPDGSLVLLMADHQTSGGYPRIANVISLDLPLAAQIGPGSKVTFDLISTRHAESLLAELERDLSFLRIACKLQTNA